MSRQRGERHRGAPGEQVQRATDLTGTLVLKHDRCFLLSDAYGDVRRDQRGLGLYLGDTRVLSRYELRLDGQRPVVLRTSGSASWRGTIQMTNPDLARNPMENGDAAAVLSRQSLGIVRDRIIADAFEERIRVQNYTLHPERCVLTLTLDADFADIFEVRGAVRDARGERQPTDITPGLIGFGYTGLDGRFRRTWVRSSAEGQARPVPVSDDPDGSGHGVLLAFGLLIAAGWRADRWTSGSRPRCSTPRCRRARSSGRPPARVPTDDPEAAHRAWHATSTNVTSPHAAADRAFHRGMADLRLLVDPGPLPGERYIAAGIPWYDTLFGRDSIITALQMLPIRPRIARDTLTVLARLQATERMTSGATPSRARSCTSCGRARWPRWARSRTRPTTARSMRRRCGWCCWASTSAGPATWSSLTGYGPRPLPRCAGSTGPRMPVDSWPTSVDRTAACATRAGRTRPTPSAGRTAAWRRAPSPWSRCRGTCTRAGWPWPALPADAAMIALAEREEAAATAIQRRFEDRFWLEDAGTYAVALDGDGLPVDAVTSNPGHALWSGICSPGAGSPGGRVAAQPGAVQRLGHPDPVQPDGRLQPHQLSHRQHLAA